MRNTYTQDAINTIEKKYGKIAGRKSKNANIYLHDGNWAYAPTPFYASDIKVAINTALNIDTSLSVWNDDTKEFEMIFDIDWLYERFNDSDAMELVKGACLQFGITEDDLDYKGSIRVIETSYQEWTEETLPEGAEHLVGPIWI